MSTPVEATDYAALFAVPPRLPICFRCAAPLRRWRMSGLLCAACIRGGHRVTLAPAPKTACVDCGVPIPPVGLRRWRHALCASCRRARHRRWDHQRLQRQVGSGA